VATRNFLFILFKTKRFEKLIHFDYGKNWLISLKETRLFALIGANNLPKIQFQAITISVNPLLTPNTRAQIMSDTFIFCDPLYVANVINK
jgi:hypothetical protein